MAREHVTKTSNRRRLDSLGRGSTVQTVVTWTSRALSIAFTRMKQILLQLERETDRTQATARAKWSVEIIDWWHRIRDGKKAAVDLSCQLVEKDRWGWRERARLTTGDNTPSVQSDTPGRKSQSRWRRYSPWRRSSKWRPIISRIRWVTCPKTRVDVRCHDLEPCCTVNI